MVGRQQRRKYGLDVFVRFLQDFYGKVTIQKPWLICRIARDDFGYLRKAAVVQSGGRGGLS